MLNNSNGGSGFDPDAPVSSLSPGGEPENDTCETAGVRINRRKVFEFKLNGGEVYELLEILRRLAVNSANYAEVAQAVKHERLLYAQARGQGF
jgi:hypothetical protein